MMAFPTLADLPPPPPGKAGFPWTEASSSLAPAEYANLPRVAVVTPSYNQGQFIEETIRSVLLQGYPNLEYIIIDGGSKDSSVEIIRKYERWLACWVSEPDHGQVHAVAKGWAKSSGEILAYLNSDDTYLPYALAIAVRALGQTPEAAAICGGELVIDTKGMVIAERFVQSARLADLMHFTFVPQPSIFLRRDAFERAGGLDQNFQLVFDFELWTRLVRLGEIHCIKETLATTRWHSSAKTFVQRPRVLAELEQVTHKVFASPVGRKFSPRERQTIEAGLHLLAVSIYFDNLFQDIGLVVSNSLTAVTKWPPIARQLLGLVWHRTRVLLAYYFLRYWKRKNVEKTPWGFGYTGIHWSAWYKPREGQSPLMKS